MGRIKEYLHDIAEKFQELLQTRGTWQEGIDAMEEILPEDEFEFFIENIDAVQSILGYGDEQNGYDRGPSMDEAVEPHSMYAQGEHEMAESWEEAIAMLLLDQGYSSDDVIQIIEDYEDIISDGYLDGDSPDQIIRTIINKINGVSEASGLKGDVLRPWSGRRRRANMGYGRGNRGGFNPRNEIDTEEEILRQEALMQDVEDDQQGPVTSTIIDDEEVFDVEGSYNNESIEMPPILEWSDDEDEDIWVTINGKRVHKNSREYQRWYEEEGEFDDVEGREYRRNRY
jgi:hypothetical protein